MQNYAQHLVYTIHSSSTCLFSLEAPALSLSFWWKEGCQEMGRRRMCVWDSGWRWLDMSLPEIRTRWTEQATPLISLAPPTHWAFASSPSRPGCTRRSFSPDITSVKTCCVGDHTCVVWFARRSAGGYLCTFPEPCMPYRLPYPENFVLIRLKIG